MSERVRKAIKESVFTFGEIAMILDTPRTTFFKHLKDDSLTTKELFEIITILGLSDEEIIKLIKGE